MINLNQYIGKKVKGVSFVPEQYRRIAFNSRMNAHIGHEGVIQNYCEDDDSFRIDFESPVKDYWFYPVEVILPQLEGELIGYTINDEKYAKIIAKLTNNSVKCLLKLTSEGVHFSHGGYVEAVIKKYDLLDKCTPVYRQKEIKLPVVKGYNGEDKGDYIQYGCAQLLKSWFEKSENRSISSLELSSGIRIDIEEMDAISKYLKSKK